MQTLANNLADRNLSDAEYQLVRFLTSGCCEDTGDVGEHELSRLGLQCQSFRSGHYYPLSIEEQMFVAGEYLDLDGEGLLCLMGYSALLQGVKYLVPTIEISFDESVPDTMLTQPEAAERNRKAKAIATNVAKATGGFYMWRSDVSEMYDETHGRYVTELFIPLEYAKTKASGWNAWQLYLKGLASYKAPQ